MEYSTDDLRRLVKEGFSGSEREFAAYLQAGAERRARQIDPQGQLWPDGVLVLAWRGDGDAKTGGTIHVIHAHDSQGRPKTYRCSVTDRARGVAIADFWSMIPPHIAVEDLDQQLAEE